MAFYYIAHKNNIAKNKSIPSFNFLLLNICIMERKKKIHNKYIQKYKTFFFVLYNKWNKIEKLLEDTLTQIVGYDLTKYFLCLMVPVYPVFISMLEYQVDRPHQGWSTVGVEEIEFMNIKRDILLCYVEAINRCLFSVFLSYICFLNLHSVNSFFNNSIREKCLLLSSFFYTSCFENGKEIQNYALFFINKKTFFIFFLLYMNWINNRRDIL